MALSVKQISRFVRWFSSVSPSLRPRRVLMYVPGSSTKMLSKVNNLTADCVCLDLEDAVAASEKENARANIKNYLNGDKRGESEVLVRINSVGSGLEERDLDTILSISSSPSSSLPDGLVLPKVSSAADLMWLLEGMHKRIGDRMNRMSLIGLVESARGLLNLKEICEAAPNLLQGLIFGADDYAADVGAVRTQSSEEVWYARNQVLLYCAAYSLQAIDMVCIELHNPERLLRESVQGFTMGYSGKQIIHPNQIDIVTKSFTPAHKNLLWALKVTEAAVQNQGRGAFVVDGSMIDLPTVKQAQRLLARAPASVLAAASKETSTI